MLKQIPPDKALRQVALVAYHFPPHGGVAGQRAAKFAKYLPAFGWMPTIVSAAPTCYPQDLLDPDLGRQVDACEVVRLWYPGPWLLFNRGAKPREVAPPRPHLEGGVRSSVTNLGLACDTLPWAFRVMTALRNLARRSDLHAVITMSPPGWSHVAGHYARRRLGIPWLMDLRDQWHGHPAHPGPSWWSRLEREVEHASLATADAVVTATATLSRHYRSIGAAGRVETITNGFDPADYDGLDRAAARSFTVAHVGSLGVSRSPLPFLDLWRRFLSESGVDPAAVALRFVGPTGRIDFSGGIARDARLAATVTFRPFVTHREALAEMLGASVLLLLPPTQPGSEHMLTGKLFEYLAARRPVLALVPEGELATLIREREAGISIPPDDHGAIVQQLQDFYQRHRSGKLLVNGGSNLGDFDRRVLTQRLAQILDDLVHLSRRASDPHQS